MKTRIYAWIVVVLIVYDLTGHLLGLLMGHVEAYIYFDNHQLLAWLVGWPFFTSWFKFELFWVAHWGVGLVLALLTASSLGRNTTND